MLNPDAVTHALAGGAMMGAAVALFLFGTGRVTGISGMFSALLAGEAGAVRCLFLLGLVLSPWLARLLGLFGSGDPLTEPHWAKLILAGLLVGVGTQLGSGCTSGHGLCGLSNLSPRSLTATLVFMGVAALVVHFGFGGLT